MDLGQITANAVIAASPIWNPNPGETGCLRVKGLSMSSPIDDDDFAALDSSQNDTEPAQREDCCGLAQTTRTVARTVSIGRWNTDSRVGESGLRTACVREGPQLENHGESALVVSPNRLSY
jgi:hypothetical protein